MMASTSDKTRSHGLFYYLIIILISLNLKYSQAELYKCCSDGFILNNVFECVRSSENNTELQSQLLSENLTIFDECTTGIYKEPSIEVNDSEPVCLDTLMNGTVVTLICDNTLNNQTHGCDSTFKLLHYWGATMMVFATMIYTPPYIIVVIVYCVYADLRKKAFDKSLLCFNSMYATLNIVIITIGFFDLCHSPLSSTAYSILGIAIVFLTQTTCLWLLLLCFDMTLNITRFRWAPASTSKTRSENRKFRVYSMFSWGLAIVPTLIVIITEFAPLPEDSPLRPNFANFYGSPTKALLIYQLAIPILSLFTNTILFIYTSYRMIKIKKENKILKQKNAKSARKEYFVYLKLYFIMDAPWLSGALSAIFPSLWVLKFFRILQPLLMLYIILPKKRILSVIGCMKKNEEKDEEKCLQNINETKRTNVNKSQKDCNLT